jgi:hypothetical protein
MPNTFFDKKCPFAQIGADLLEHALKLDPEPAEPTLMEIAARVSASGKRGRKDSLAELLASEDLAATRND